MGIGIMVLSECCTINFVILDKEFLVLRETAANENSLNGFPSKKNSSE